MKKQILIIICVLVLAAGAIAAYLIISGKKGRANEDELDTSMFQTPEGFVWEGSYIDSRDGRAVLTIEKNGNSYICSIGVPSEDISYMNTYEFTATESADGSGLEYEGGVRTEYLIPDDPGENPVTSNEIYNDGTGTVYYLYDSVYWYDQKDNAGQNLAFSKQEAN
ncbi:MAG: hypothetical protein IJ796_04565 [Lachnospiraceae bacterium]|nr:hypothetical protein [Lachnospiraceae bacterium]